MIKVKVLQKLGHFGHLIENLISVKLEFAPNILVQMYYNPRLLTPTSWFLDEESNENGFLKETFPLYYVKAISLGSTGRVDLR